MDNKNKTLLLLFLFQKFLWAYLQGAGVAVFFTTMQAGLEAQRHRELNI